MNHGFCRIALATPKVWVADPMKNLGEIKALYDQAQAAMADVLVFPELSLTSFTCGDLFFQSSLQTVAQQALLDFIAHTQTGRCLVFVGFPHVHLGKLYNTAAVVCGGELLGLVPKSYLVNYKEYSEARWFVSAQDLLEGQTTRLGPYTVPFGADLLFSCKDQPDLIVAAEICEDLWAPIPPSTLLAQGGATVLVNLSAATEQIGKGDKRRKIVAEQSERTIGIYAYSGAGYGESTTDCAFSGHGILAQCGDILVESRRYLPHSRLVTFDADVERNIKARMQNPTFGKLPPGLSPRFRRVEFSQAPLARPLLTQVSPMPFLPGGDPAVHFEEMLQIQCAALAKRLEASGQTRVVIGISGGLDSTMALLACVYTFDQTKRPRQDIIALTMPSFGTSSQTLENAKTLMSTLGVSQREIPISQAVLQHFSDIGHDPAKTDSTYENAQARERTQILMDLANQVGGLVLGTGNLSELALGFTTYGGDHLSMYAINAGIPKSVLQLYVAHLAQSQRFGGDVSQVLEDILATPISPELLPLDETGEIAQKTQELIGPYLLHDFFLYHLVHSGFSREKILALAEIAFLGEHDAIAIAHWLDLFLKRFYAFQFKRSCMPDGVKIGAISLSPRGDWRMPSDSQPIA